jgi:hypothetical protein
MRKFQSFLHVIGLIVTTETGMNAMKIRELAEGLLFCVCFLLTCEDAYSYTSHNKKKGLPGRSP